ncbi:hypothetical protein H6G17_29245 [Chroococcidiopsis sp. FACHB-1243]|uniref:hypothetical protein n=1 Tax=Chroococcidiopsis sp. [FACHB-1243] TaxID=2692781 RepID=UPI00177B11AD|nr:hypothetical protein [Chroococcidiopsis sp. [FACHB-1243]]MBD2309530.1 hypothetical protein [Chroococcidiopsis sp. [FACHB-1243]]
MYILPLINKLFNPIRQLLKKSTFTVLSLGIAAGTIILKTEPASAYCANNNSKEAITVLQLPISAESFKAVIKPGESKCCAWDNKECTGEEKERYGQTSFLVYKGEANIDALSVAQFVKELSLEVANAIDPERSGKLVKGAVAAINKLEQINVLGKALGYPSKDNLIGALETYNGGMITYDGNQVLGCWSGSQCKEQNVNGDGTEGYQP